MPQDIPFNSFAEVEGITCTTDIIYEGQVSSGVLIKVLAFLFMCFCYFSASRRLCFEVPEQRAIFLCIWMSCRSLR